MRVGDILADVGRRLDDVHLAHASTDVALRLVNWVQQWVALRWQLTRQTTPVALIPNLPLYHLPTVMPRAVSIVRVTIDAVPLWPVPMRALRDHDPQWLARPCDWGMAPMAYYVQGQGGILWMGFYPVPTQEDTAQVTALVVPEDLLDVSSPLVIPDAYGARVVETTTGLLMLWSERHMEMGLQTFRTGLDLKAMAP
jgi:hypothetical protein